MVACENRFLKTRDGNIYSTTVCNYDFWRRYLQFFDEVIVFARVAEVEQDELPKQPASGPNVSFMSLPTFIGPWQFLGQYAKLHALAKDAINKADAFILRTSGAVTTLLWYELKRRRIPYGIEAMTDPWDGLAPGTVKSILRPLLRLKMRWELARQCHTASAVSYVTEHKLQKRYPPRGWSTHYSSIELPEQAIIGEKELERRLSRLEEAVRAERPFEICHIGSMSALYKAQDVLIEAVTICHKKGINVELTLLGDGRYQRVFVEKAKQLGFQDFVDFAGRVPPGQPVIEHLDSADMFVLPSLTEGVPRSLIEAMARGLPCIASNMGGIPELLDSEDMVPPRDVQALAARIAAVMQDKERLKRMARRNLEKSKEYRSSELNKRRVEFFAKVAKAAKACRID
jgi:glycosyltransferase involved in cell wall biosynthesis